MAVPVPSIVPSTSSKRTLFLTSHFTPLFSSYPLLPLPLALTWPLRVRRGRVAVPGPSIVPSTSPVPVRLPRELDQSSGRVQGWNFPVPLTGHCNRYRRQVHGLRCKGAVRLLNKLDQPSGRVQGQPFASSIHGTLRQVHC